MPSWSIDSLTLDLLYTWRISRNATDSKTNLIVTVTDGIYSGRGEAAPNIRYQETPGLIHEQFRSIQSSLNGCDPENISSVLSASPLLNPLRFAVESAAVHFLSSRDNRPVYDILGIPETTARGISFTIPIMDTGRIKDFYSTLMLQRFPYVKLKINADDGTEAVRYLSGFTGSKIMVDANEAYRDVDQAIRFLESIRKFPVEFVEQPIPAGMEEEALYMKKYSPFPLFADESIRSDADFSLLCRQFDGVNIKLMKTGGYFTAINLLREARQSGMKTMIGCMVETTLGISAGLRMAVLSDYADLDSFLLLKDEPFDLVTESEGVIALKKAEHVW